MDWLFAPDGAAFYLPSAILILWSALFIFLHYHLKKSNVSLLLWGIALAVFSLQPIDYFLWSVSPYLSCVFYWLVTSIGSSVLIAGLFKIKKNRKLRLRALLHYSLLTLSALISLAFEPKTIWLAIVYSIQGAFVAGGTILHACRSRQTRNIPAYFALLVFSAGSAYYAYALLATGSIPGYIWISLLKALILSNMLSINILAQTAISANSAKARLETLVENTSQGLAFLSSKGKLLQVNSRMLEIFGVDAPQLNDSEPSNAQIVLEYFASSWNFGSETNELTVDFDKLRSDGCKVSRSGFARLSISVRRIMDTDNAAEGTFIQADDVTELKNTLNELMEKRYSMELMFKAAGACEYSKEGGVLHSLSWFRALGYDFDSLGVFEFREFIHPQDRYKYTDEQAFGLPRLGAAFSAELRIRNAEGSYVWYYVSSCNELIDNRLLTLGMAINIDMNKRLESYAMQNDRLAAVGQLANGVVHDINNYLMTIQTSLGMIDSTADEKQKMKFASYMQEAIANSTGMLKRLVSFSKGDEVEYAPVSMNTMLCTSKELLQRSLTKGVKLKFTCRSAKDVILGNYYELQNIILNIGLNARDALPEADGEIAISTWVADSNPLKPGKFDWYCISIKDNGCGMSAEVQKRIFDPFFTTKPHGKGSGLGLFTAYGYIQRHGGTISVESVQGAGTEFVLAFPLMSEASASGGNCELAEETAKPCAG